MKYFIYTRKSTDSEERQILSIESQLAELREFAAKEKLEIVLSAPVQDEAGGRGVWSLPFRPPSQSFIISVRIFSNRHRQLGKAEFGSPSARARQPILGANWNFCLCSAKRNARSGLFIFCLIIILKFGIIILKE